MKAEKFESIVNTMLEHCRSTLLAKAKEYATEDRLHNFKQSAHMQQITPEQALGGMMSKHTISVYDMISETDRPGESFPLELWDEKIGDHINYLLLLRALVEEDDS